MRKLLLLITLVVVTTVNSIAYDISLSEAAQKVMQNLGYESKTSNIYLAGETSTDWFIFVDPTPSANWSHKCYYYHVFKDSGNGMTKSIEKWPPSQTEELVALRINTIDNGNFALQTKALSVLASEAPSLNSTAKTYAVIISGGGMRIINHERYWYDCSYIYQILRQRYSVPSSNIYIAMADGKGKLDLDNDGVDDVKYSATKNNLASIFDDLSQKIKSEDHLFVFVTDHGYEDGSIVLWDMQLLYPKELNALLEKINADYISVLLGQCYSGAFIQELAKPGRVIMTASDASHPSYASYIELPSGSTVYVDSFLYNWTSAIAGSYTDGSKINAEIDDDGYISMFEAFQFAKENDRTDDTPLYSSMHHDTAYELSINRIPTSNDLFIKRTTFDSGISPLQTESGWWNSPDIWLSESPNVVSDNYLDISNLDDVYVNVRVSNRGFMPTTQSKFLHIYYNKPTTYPNNKIWSGQSLNGILGKSISMTVAKPLQESTSEVVSIKWTIPEEFKTKDIKHAGLLATLSNSPSQPIWDGMEKSNFIYNNDFALNNIYPHLNAGNEKVTFAFPNPKNDKRQYSLQITSGESENSTKVDLFDHMNVYIVLSPTLYNSWKNGGSVAYDINTTQQANRRFLFNSFDSKLSGLSLDALSSDEIELELVPKNNFINYSGNFNIVQIDDETNEAVGGIQMIANFGLSLSINIRLDSYDTEYNILETDLNTTESSFIWTNEDGEILSRENTLKLQKSISSQIINLYATYKSDGGFQTINIEPMPYFNIQNNITSGKVDITIENSIPNNSVLVVSDNTSSIRRYVISGNSGEMTQIDVSSFEDGVLTLSLSNENNVLQTSKIIKQ